MGNFYLLFGCLLAGWLLQVAKRVPENAGTWPSTESSFTWHCRH